MKQPRNSWMLLASLYVISLTRLLQPASALSIATASPGAAVLLFQESNRPQTSWNKRSLKLTTEIKSVRLDRSGHDGSGGKPDNQYKGVQHLVGQSAKSGSVFRDCPVCPEMTVIPQGNFTMGSPASEKRWVAGHGGNLESVADEAPQHIVSLRSFAIGKYDVTRDQYAAFVRETRYPDGDGCGADSFKWKKQAGVSWQNPGFSQTGLDPVVCVSWQDAHAYISWLNGKVRPSTARSADGPYRLPSESEWEYAARAASATAFWWGDDDGGASDHVWYKENSGGRTHPLGLKPANAFGLYDVVGNVWQWTEDCYAENYSNAPADGSANELRSPDVSAFERTMQRDQRGHETAAAARSCMRVDRGGSWLYPAWLLRSATRERNPAEYRDVIMGFRVAKTIE